MSLEGQQIDRYRILRLLGSGGMGDVYLAEDPRIEQQVAIKVIRAEASSSLDTQASQEAARLFQREAKAIVKLDHPNILPLYDYGEEQLGNQTIIYLVMPYRAEGSLVDWLKQRGQPGPLALQEVAHIVEQAASALQHAHDRQIIHQDVKPSNFLLRHRPEKPTRPDLLLADFGIARLATATASASQSIRGTPTYMAPEQWEGHPVPATDQYALAIMAYDLLTGRPPFQGAPGPLMFQHLTAQPPPPSSVNPRLSSDLDAILLHALAKRPDQRFASMTAFANAFQQATQALPAADAPPSRAATPMSAPAYSGDIRAVLAISTTEAQMGTMRILTLPGGRQVRITVPAGVQDGQVVRLDGQGETSPRGGPDGALILSILVKTAEEPSLLSTASAAGAEHTVLTANPTIPAARPEMTTPPSSLVRSSQAATSASQTSYPHTEQALPSTSSVEWPANRSSQSSDSITIQPQRGLSRRAVVLGLAGLALVGVAGGGIALLSHTQGPQVSSPLSTPPPTAYPTSGPTITSILHGAVATPPSKVNLTSEGTSDWIHWGLYTGSTVDRKNEVPLQISTFRTIGNATARAYSGNYVAYSWSDGTPDRTIANTTTAVYVSGVNNGFSFSVPASTTTQTLRVYVDVYLSQGKFTASLTDSSGLVYTDESLNNTGGVTQAVYTLTYRSSSNGQQLTITFVAVNAYNSVANVALEAATLQ